MSLSGNKMSSMQPNLKSPTVLTKAVASNMSFTTIGMTKSSIVGPFLCLKKNTNNNII
jgi:hypothetical protein